MEYTVVYRIGNEENIYYYTNLDDLFRDVQEDLEYARLMGYKAEITLFNYFKWARVVE